MSDFETRYYILPQDTGGFPVEADRSVMSMGWDGATVEDRLSHGLEVAPGVRMAILRAGDHWRPAAGETISGTLIAVRTRLA